MSYQFRDPIHGMIEVSDQEIKLISHPTFQRLRYIHQLGTSYLVYHGADHCRFGHSLGVMQLISRAMDSLHRRGYLDSLCESEFKRLRQIARLIGLLHDVGHGPFSHVGEDSGLYPEMTDFHGRGTDIGHEVYTRLLVRDHFGTIIDEEFKHLDITRNDILMFLSGRVSDKRYHFLKSLISGQLDADRMDYLLRDSYYCGVQYGKYDLHRILDTMCICCPDQESDFGWQLGIESDGIHAVEEFIFARYWMFIQVYFHKTRRIYDYYLVNHVKSMLRDDDKTTFPTNLNEYLSWADYRVLHAIERKGKEGHKWAANLYHRKHLKEAFVSKPHHETDEKKDELDRVAWVIVQVKQKFLSEYNDGLLFIDQAKTSTSKSLIDIPLLAPDAISDEDEKMKVYAIPVLDKHDKKLRAIQDYSLSIQNITDKKVNILRVYATEELKENVRDFCYHAFNIGYDEYKLDLESKKKTFQELGQYLAQEAQAEQERKSLYK